MLFSCVTPTCVWISVSFATEHDSCSVCNWFRKVYCRSLLFQLWKWYFYVTAVTRWNRFGVKAICGSLLSNMAGKQNAAAQPNITRPEIIDAAPVILCGGVFSVQGSSSQVSAKLFKLKLHFSAAASGRVRMKSSAYQALTEGEML